MLSSLTRAGVLVALAALFFVFAGVASAAPSNDDYASAVLLSGVKGEIPAGNDGAAMQDGEPSASCWNDCATVWFAFDAPTDGTLDIGANADLATTHLAVFAGTPSPDAQPVATDYYGLRFPVAGGTRYYIAVDTEFGTGNFYIDWTFSGSASPANDMWSSLFAAGSIAGASGSVVGTTVGATAEDGEPAGAGHSVWFHWIAPQDGIVSFTADGGQDVTAYTGGWLGDLKALGASAPVAAGDVLSVRVDGVTPAAFTLSWQTAAAPAPALNVPTSITVDANAPAGRTVTFDASATDWKGRGIGATCSKASGYVFPIGTTTVACAAVDAGGRTAQATFDVHVKGVPEQLADLRAAVVGAQLDARTTAKLTSQLDDARKQFDDGRTTAVCGGLSDFVDAVQRQSGKAIPAAAADAFVTAGWRIRAVVNCA